MSALVNSLSDTEQALIRETMAAEMDPLDEDALMDLHGRIRRARNKYTGLYRRQASARVSTVGGRGMARPKNRRNFDRAEVFEDALARVSRRLAVLAKQSAAELKAERLEAARKEPAMAPAKSARSSAAIASRSAQSPRPARKSGPRSASPQTADRKPTSPALRKRQASTMATGARRQAKRDSR